MIIVHITRHTISIVVVVGIKNYNKIHVIFRQF